MSAPRRDAEVLIVGGGPAGLAAAIELRRLGVGRVLVVDREGTLGGIPRHSHHTGFGLRDLRRVMTGPRYAARYVALAERAGVELSTSTSVTGWAAADVVEITAPAGRAEIKASAVLLATGCRERPRAARLVPGDRPRGVFTTGAIQQLVYLERQPVGRRAVVVGAEHVSFSAVLTLAHGGARTVAMVTDQPRHQTYAALAWAIAGRLRVPVLTSSAVTRIVGRSRVEAVEVTDGATGRVQTLECDTVVFTGDWIPDHELARSGDLVIDPKTRAPRVDTALRTSGRGIFAAGNVLHAAETADVAALSGRHAAGGIHAFLATGTWSTASPIELYVEEPLRWISPSAIGASTPPRKRFLLRVDRFCDAAVLEIVQGRRVLARERYRRLVPARSIQMRADWLPHVAADAGPIVVRLANRGRYRQG